MGWIEKRFAYIYSAWKETLYDTNKKLYYNFDNMLL